MSNDCSLRFRASCIFGIVWFVCLKIGMLSTVELLLRPNLTCCKRHILQAPNAGVAAWLMKSCIDS